MSEISLFLLLVILTGIFIAMSYIISTQKTNYRHGSHTLIAVCSRGIYAIALAEGYVILTEDITQAKAVCTDLDLNLHPYWSQIEHVYPTSAEALANLKQLETYLGPSTASFVKRKADGISLCFQGYISTKNA